MAMPRFGRELKSSVTCSCNVWYTFAISFCPDCSNSSPEKQNALKVYIFLRNAFYIKNKTKQSKSNISSCFGCVFILCKKWDPNLSVWVLKPVEGNKRWSILAGCSSRAPGWQEWASCVETPGHHWKNTHTSQLAWHKSWHIPQTEKQ